MSTRKVTPVDVFGKFIEHHEPVIEIYDNGEFVFCLEHRCAACKAFELCDNTGFGGLYKAEGLEEVQEKFPEYFL